MPCVSAIFAVVRCLSISLSLRLSVALVHCIQTDEDIVKLLSRPGSHFILVFDSSADAQFQWEPLSRGAKYRGLEILRFSFISESVRYRTMITMER